jgi:phosphodiesterase/alkaline phosphatase D-like protein
VGTYTLNLWAEKDGLVVDQILLARDPAFTPTGGAPLRALSHGPMVGYTTPTTSRIWYRTKSSETVVVRYGTQPNLLGAVTSTPVNTQASNEFTGISLLTGLTANTRYYYQVEINGVAQDGQPHSFLAAPGGQAQFTVRHITVLAA